MNIHDFQKMKENNQKISMVSCYEYWSAKIVSLSNVDCILVGDSMAMVVYGHPNTLHATTEMIALHTQAVARGANNKFIIGDMPFCSYRKDLTTTMNAVEKIMQAGAHAVKLEGAIGNLNTIDHIVNSGIPVMGHIGLTPQSINTLGGFKVQGKEQKVAESIKIQAKELESAGCFAIVLECVPNILAKEITKALHIPTIGIGAGPHTSGQVLVLQDLLGTSHYIKPKFLKTFLDGSNLILGALNAYDEAVKSSSYPDKEVHCY